MLFIFPYSNFILQHRDKKPVVGPFFDICKELWNCSDQEIVHIITVIMTSTDGEIVAEFGGYDAVMRLIDMFLNGEEGFLICMCIIYFFSTDVCGIDINV